MVARGKYNGKSIFLFTFLLLDEMLNFFFRTVICIALYEKTAFKTDFGPREVPKLENLHFHAFSGWYTYQSPK